MTAQPLPKPPAGDDRELLVGVDVGTTRVKALAVRPDGAPVGAGERTTPWRRDGGRTEVDMDELSGVTVAAVLDAVTAAHQLWARGRPVSVLGIGFTGMAETGALLDRAGRPCAPGLAWYDLRAEPERIRLAAPGTGFEQITGLQLGPLPSLAKILWLWENLPSARSAVRHLSVGEWMVRCLGGEEAGELSLLSRTGMWEIAENRPWPVARELLGRDLLPDRAVLAGTPLGVAGPGSPAALRGATLTVAGHDHQVAAFAAGAARPGVLFDSLGTAEALVRHLPVPSHDPGLGRRMAGAAGHGVSVGRAVVPDQLCVLAGMVTGLTLERVAGLLGMNSRQARHGLGLAAEELAGSDLNLSGWDGEGLTISGIGDDATPAALWRAAVAGLTGACDRLLARVEEIAGPRTATVVAGGWVNNPAVEGAKRRQHGSFRRSEVQEAGAVGAAVMAGIAAGVLQRPAAGALPRWRDGRRCDDPIEVPRPGPVGFPGGS
ncbi:MAG: hypothetical protein QG608_1227 [Actinomycetota bacterium]|nr:hypothetical protein [Actinomycetota bacterium]